MTKMVSDEVWSTLDPEAARPSRTVRRRIIALVGVTAVVAVLAAIGLVSGLFRPQVWVEIGAVMDLNQTTHSFTYELRFHNDGWFEEHLTDVTWSDPNVRTRFSHPIGITHDDPVYETLHVTVLDCRHAPFQPTLRLHFDRMWGELTTTVTADPLDPLRAPGGRDRNIAIFMDGAPAVACGRA